LNDEAAAKKNIVVDFKKTDHAEQNEKSSQEGEETDSSISTFKTEITTSQNTGENSSEVVSPFLGIIDSVKRLMRLANQIKSASSGHRIRRILEYKITDFEDVDPVESCREYTKARLKFLFKLEDRNNVLLERLGDANAFRRKKFIYLRKRFKKLQYVTPKGSKPHLSRIVGPKSCVTSTTIVRPGWQTTPSEPEVKNMSHSSRQYSTSEISLTTATSFSRQKLFDDELSVQETTKTTAKSIIQINRTLIPPPPRIAAGVLWFNCTYCSIVQPAAEKSPRRWRQHFMKDLSPLICLVDDCQEQVAHFHNQEEWINHMASHNSRYLCQRGHESWVGTEKEFEHHILKAHGEFSQQHMSIFKKSSRTAQIAFSRCPICNETQENIAKSERGKGHFDTFWSHIANELTEIASWSLPEGEDDAESISSDQMEQRIAEASTVGSNTESLVIDVSEPLNLEPWEDSRDHHVASRDHSTTDEWSFVEKSPRKLSYEGPDFDKTLGNFIRRHQLKKMLDEGGMSDPVLPCIYVEPKRNKDFYGRQSLLEKLETALHPAAGAKDALSVVTLVGPSGCGKTQAAMEYVWQTQTQYDAIFWVHADTEGKLANDFAKIALRLEFIAEKTADSQNTAFACSLVKAWLTTPFKHINGAKEIMEVERSEKARWLLVFDHVVDARTLSHYWPFGCQYGSILITSRKPIPWSDANLRHSTEFVEDFNPEDSAAFLSQLIKTDHGHLSKVALGKYAHHSPSQLKFLAKMIDAGKYSVEKYVEATKEDKAQEVLLQLHTEEAVENRTDFAEWALETLEKGTLIDILSMLDADSIPEKLLVNVPDTFAISGYPRTIEDYYEARNELMKYTFVTRNRTGQTLSIPTFIQDASRAKMDKTRYRDVFNACVMLINEHWPYQPFTWRHSIDR
jgi:ABC-type dipeptide/oligopeptide/nickel transport system ATPase subunit